MKRYEPTFSSRWYPTMQEGEADEGEWVLYRDVLKETIPRPDPEAARRAVGNLMQAVKDAQTSWFADHPDSGKYQALCEKVKEASDEVLRLLGVE